jgi:TolB-like protein/DNA-binding SARP family transcriptional activator/Tfp pilus assembly protein PilF
MYRLRTFGGFAIERDGVPLDDLGAHRKALALLAILAARGGASRDRLMALLWPDGDRDRARNSLKQAVHVIRRRLGARDVILGTAELRLNPEHIGSDVEEFTGALRDDDLEAAVRLYAGPFLDAVHLDRTAEFERWADGERAELARSYRGALERLAIAAEDAGDPARAAGWWRKLQAADALDSRVAVRLMLALEAAGDRAGAVRHAAIHDVMVRDELGIPPDPAVTELVAALKARPPADDRSAPVPTVARGRRDEEPAESDVPEAAPLREPTSVAVITPPPVRTRRALLPAALLAAAAGIVALLIVSSVRAPTGAPADGGVAATAASHLSIVVLPFVDVSPDRDREYFSDGMTDELIVALSAIDGLKVVARTSAFQFRGGNADVREVGERLGVAHVLEGTVRMDGTRLRVTVQLVDAADGYRLWSESYDRELSDLFEVQAEISSAIVAALRQQFDASAPVDIPPPAPTRSLAAYEHYLRGLYFLNRLQIPGAIESLLQATSIDPRFARAHAALAEARAVPVAYGDGAPEDDYRRALAAAETALRIDPHLADGHAALGWLQLIGLRWDDAGRSLQHAIELDPRAPRARLYHALFLHRRGDLDGARMQLEHAREIDPLSLPVNALYGSILADLGRTAEGVQVIRAALELDPAHPIAHAVLAHIHLGEGRIAEAIVHYEVAAATLPNSYYTGFLGHAYGRAGRTTDARRLLDQLRDRAAAGAPVSQGAIGWILLALDEYDEAYRRLENAALQRDVFLTVYGVLSNRFVAGPYLNDARFRHVRGLAGLSS